MRALLCLCLFTGTCYANGPFLEGGVTSHWPTAFDLAEIGGGEGYGAEDDSGPLILSARFGLGWRLERLEITAFAAFGIGGIASGPVEERYFGEEDNVGGPLTGELGLIGDLHWPLSKRLSAFAGLMGGWQRMSSSSGVGSASLNNVVLGGRAGLKLEIHRARSVHGAIKLALEGRHHVPLEARVGSGDDPLFEGNEGGGLQTGGALLAYTLYFR